MEIIDFIPQNKGELQTEFLQNLHDTGIPLPYFIPKIKENHFFYKNGLSNIIPRLKVKVHSDMEKCYKLWQTFSHNKTIFDLWDFRYSWYQGYNYKPLFYTLYENKKPLAVLPLWFSEVSKEYEWFGSWWNEDNQFFLKDEHFLDILTKIAPNPILLNAIDANFYSHNSKFLYPLVEDHPKNTKNIGGYKRMEDYLEDLNKKHRYNFKYDHKKIMTLNPKVKILNAKRNIDHFEKLVALNTARLDGVNREKSDLYEDSVKNAFIAIIKNSGSYKTQFVEIYIRGKLAAIDLVMMYKDTYYPFIGGNNIKKFKGIGNFILYNEFEDAIKKKYKVVDCLQIDYGWKHRFFDQQKLYKLAR